VGQRASTCPAPTAMASPTPCRMSDGTMEVYRLPMPATRALHSSLTLSHDLRVEGLGLRV
jgi:hypothetical protein